MVKSISIIVNNVFALFCGLMLFCVSTLTCIDVLMGFFFGAPIRGAVEIIELTMPWVVSLSLGFALIRGAHVRVTLFIDRIRGTKRCAIDGIDHFLGFVYFMVLLYGASLQFWSSWIIKEQKFAALITLPAWLAKLALPVGFILMAIQHLIEFGEIIKKEKS